MRTLKVFVILLVLVSFVSTSFCPDAKKVSDDKKLEAFLCQAGRWVLKTYVPYGNVAVQLLDKFFGKNDKKAPNVWDTIKGNVENYVREKIDAIKLADINTWHKSMTSRIDTCQAKLNLNIKKSCFKNLQEDLSGYEPRFRGNTMRETAQYLKYYDIYIITFISVSDILKNLSDSTLKASIDRDVSLKAKIFVDYLQDAIPKTDAYVCRQIRVKLEEDYLFWKEVRLIWPTNNAQIPWFLNVNTTKFDVWHDLFNVSTTCPTFDIMGRYEANIVDVNDGSRYPGGPWYGNYCGNNVAITNMIPQIYDMWKIFMKICVESAENLWLNEIRDRLKTLKDLI